MASFESRSYWSFAHTFQPILLYILYLAASACAHNIRCTNNSTLCSMYICMPEYMHVYIKQVKKKVSNETKRM